MEIDVSQTPVIDAYQMLVGLVTPRPIAWVTTLSPKGIVNLAPFSFYNAFGANPPVVVFSPTLRRNGTKKDTLLNIEANRQFVINASTARHAEEINHSSKEISPDESEVELVGLHTSPSTRVSPPRLRESPFALECELMQIIPVGDGPISANLVIGRIVHMHVSDDILDGNQRPDPRKLQAIARLGGEYWCKTNELFQMPRP
jgi:flavin reductase (DIM6/NTAB) family NADH-FMN oxidoreductase RutF